MEEHKKSLDNFIKKKGKQIAGELGYGWRKEQNRKSLLLGIQAKKYSTLFIILIIILTLTFIVNISVLGLYFYFNSPPYLIKGFYFNPIKNVAYSYS